MKLHRKDPLLVVLLQVFFAGKYFVAGYEDGTTFCKYQLPRIVISDCFRCISLVNSVQKGPCLNINTREN